MAITVTHSFVSPIADEGQSGIVSPNTWNAAHTITGVDGSLTPVFIPTYYISAVGSDANNGTSPTTPWQTIAKVNSVTPGPGTTFLFRAGDTFSGTLAPTAGGGGGLPVTYGTYSDVTTAVTTPPGQTFAPTNAIISTGNNGGFTSTDLSFFAIKNLTFTGSGIGTNTAHGILITNLTKDCAGFAVQNCIINGFGFNGMYLNAGNNSLTAPVLSSGFLLTGNRIFNCGENGIQFGPNNPLKGNNALSFAGVTVQNNTIYNCTGQNTIFGTSAFGGAAIVLQGVDTCLVDSNICYDNAYLANQSGGNTGQGLDTIYVASANNITIQNNELYNTYSFNTGNGDFEGIQIDFGSHNILVQYNYIHDNFSAGIRLTCGTGASTNADVQRSLSNITIRYNILANNGSATGGVITNSGFNFTSIAGNSNITNLFVYNNTVYGSLALIGCSGSNGSVFTGLAANNLLIADQKASFGSFAANGPILLLLNNAYIGGGPSVKGSGPHGNFSTLSGWLGDIGSEFLNGVSQTALTGAQGSAQLAGIDPIITAPSHTLAYVPLGKNTTTQFCLQPSSPYADNGLDLTTILLSDLGQVPNSNYPTGDDFNFKGQTYSGGGGIGDITCSRSATTATDLLPWDPPGRSFTTFGANALRITTGRGLLVEEARTQSLTTPGTPATQTTGSLGTGQYILWVNGTGTAVATGGTATIVSSEIGVQNGAIVASQGRPAYFQITVTGTVVVTVNGSLNQFQLENDPNGDQVPTSFITAAGTRDADVVTATNGTSIGLTINSRVLQGNGSGNFLCWFKLNVTPGSSQQRTLVANNSGNSFCSVQGNNASSTPSNARYKLGSTTINTGPTYLPIPVKAPKSTAAFSYRQTFGAIFDGVNGLALTANGEAATTTATIPSGDGTGPVHFGNDASGTNALNGYIERIIASTDSNVSTLVSTLSIVPITQINVNPPNNRDLFGNPVPGPKGTISVGAHQPETSASGGTVTVNGATPVTVNNTDVTTSSIILFTLKTVGGTVGAVPAVKTITPQTGFTVAATAGDTSVYNYTILG